MKELDSELNSILLEGTVATLPTAFTDGGNSMAKFVVASQLNRPVTKALNDSVTYKETVYVTVYAIGWLAESSLKELKVNTKLRIVGFLTQMWSSEVSVMSDHIEIVPKK